MKTKMTKMMKKMTRTTSSRINFFPIFVIGMIDRRLMPAVLFIAAGQVDAKTSL